MLITTVFVGLSLTAPDTVKLRSSDNLEKEIATYLHIDKNGKKTLTDDILLLDSRSDISKKPICLPKGSIWRNEKEFLKDFNLKKRPKKKNK